MSRIAHYCATCHHEEVVHTRIGAQYLRDCRCCHQHEDRPTFDYSAEPVLIETYDARTFAAEAQFHKPGSTYNADTMHRQHLCSCDACQSLAAVVTQS